MKRNEKILIVFIIVPLAVLTIYTVIVAYPIRIFNPKIISDAELKEQFRRETTFAVKDDIQTRIRPVALEEIISETEDFNQIDINTNETRRTFCVELFCEAGYEPVTTESGDVLAVKQGVKSDYIVVGAHYAEVDGPAQGILDNMLGCILISNIAEAYKNESTNFTYLFLPNL